MNPYQIKASKLIQADPDILYHIITDYNVHHPTILPKRAFTGLKVLEGGQGVGTVLEVTMKLMGQETTDIIEVVEAVPHQRVVEVVKKANMTTTFLFEPAGEGRTRVTFLTEAAGKAGLTGWFEKLLIPRLLRKVYEEELEILDQYAPTVVIE